MSLRFKYFAFITVLHIIITGLLYYIFQERKIYFICTEIIILISLYISYRLYALFTKPFEILEAGKNAILDEDFTIKYNPTGTSETDGLIGVYNNMIERLRTEKTRSEEQSYFLENLIDNSPLGMIIMDYDQNIVIINARARQFLDVKSAKGLKLKNLESDLAKEIAKIAIYSEEIISIDGLKKYKCKNHEVVHKGFPRQFIMIEEMTSEILQAEKKAYGKVIRMMAHEVNNSMGAVNSILQSMKEYGFDKDTSKEEMKEYLEVAIDRNQMLGEFTDNFAKVIRLPEPLKNKIDLNVVIRKTIDYYRLIAREKGIKFDMRTYPEPIIISADKIQLEQAFSNILKNSIESIEEDGNIIITTELDPIRLIISDDGKGIDEEAGSKLFTPFFSTKTTGQGVGLMLIRDILNNHGTEYKLYTEEEHDLTHFKMTFLK